MAPEAVTVCPGSFEESSCEEKHNAVTAETDDEDDDSLLSCCEMSCGESSPKDLEDMKPSRIVDLLDSASECVYSLFFCGYRSLFLDTYQFEDFIFYSLWMLCLHFCINEKVSNDTRHYI